MKPRWFFPFLDLNDFLDVSKLDIIVQEMLFISSTLRSVELLIDVKIVNLLKYSIDIPEETIKVYVNRNNSHFSNIQVSGLFIPAENSANITIGMNIFADTFDDKLIINDLISKYISGFLDLTVDFSRIEAKQNKNLNDLLKQISILQVKIPNLQFDHKGIGIDTHILSRGTNPSPFLLSAVIHILTSELEVVIYNPISNSELLVDLYHAEAKYENHVLGSLARREQLLITPGIYHTPRLPIKLELGIGMDILRKAMNGKIEVNATALFNVKLDSFEAELMYHGSNLKSDVRL